jgi:hypothetical protein
MKEAQEKQELRYELENLKQVLGAIEDVRGREQSLENKLHNSVRTWPSGESERWLRKPRKRIRSSAPTCIV